MSRPVWFIRHGESTANAGGTLAGHADADLTPKGGQQARALAPQLATLAPAHVWASDLRRAWRTAQLAWPRPAPPLRQWTDLRERHVGVFEGVPLREIPRPQRNRLISWADGPPKGESYAVLSRRVLSLLAREDPGEPLMLFVHGGLMRCIVGLLDGTPRHELGLRKVGNTELIERSVAPGRWQALLDEIWDGS